MMCLAQVSIFFSPIHLLANSNKHIFVALLFSCFVFVSLLMCLLSTLTPRSSRIVFWWCPAIPPTTEPLKNRQTMRRKSVFAETYDPDNDADDEGDPIIVPKSDEQRAQLLSSVENILLFRSLDREQVRYTSLYWNLPNFYSPQFSINPLVCIIVTNYKKKVFFYWHYHNKKKIFPIN